MITATQSEPASPPSEPSRPGRRVLTQVLYGLGLAVVAATFGVWVYAYSGQADRPPPDLLDDPAFAAAAEVRCARALDDVAAMPQAFDATDADQRADQVRATTGRFEALVDELEATVAGTPRDRDILGEWLTDWRTVLADRYRYADALAENPDAVFLLTDTGVNERLDRRITRMATTNDMASCGAPQDVG